MKDFRFERSVLAYIKNKVEVRRVVDTTPHEYSNLSHMASLTTTSTEKVEASMASLTTEDVTKAEPSTADVDAATTKPVATATATAAATIKPVAATAATGKSTTTSKPAPSAPPSAQAKKNSVVVKVGMVGDAQIGKTSLMVKYIEGKFDEDYIQTLGTKLFCFSFFFFLF